VRESPALTGGASGMFSRAGSPAGESHMSIKSGSVMYDRFRQHLVDALADLGPEDSRLDQRANT